MDGGQPQPPVPRYEERVGLCHRKRRCQMDRVGSAEVKVGRKFGCAIDQTIRHADRGAAVEARPQRTDGGAMTLVGQPSSPLRGGERRDRLRPGQPRHHDLTCRLPQPSRR